ncbi:MAG: hypothetical protein EYR95_08120, partial [Phormidium sp. SL48-SHIP]
MNNGGGLRVICRYFSTPSAHNINLETHSQIFREYARGLESLSNDSGEPDLTFFHQNGDEPPYEPNWRIHDSEENQQGSGDSDSEENQQGSGDSFFWEFLVLLRQDLCQRVIKALIKKIDGEEENDWVILLLRNLFQRRLMSTGTEPESFICKITGVKLYADQSYLFEINEKADVESTVRNHIEQLRENPNIRMHIQLAAIVANNPTTERLTNTWVQEITGIPAQDDNPTMEQLI